ncbi:MAG: hypothetical protein AB8B58_17515 [Roseobacter sp.]
MAVEIGSLVVRGTFGQQPQENAASNKEMHVEMQRLRRELLHEMKDLIEQANRRAKER